MKTKPTTACISVFKDENKLRETLNQLWAEVITHLEQGEQPHAVGAVHDR